MTPLLLVYECLRRTLKVSCRGFIKRKPCHLHSAAGSLVHLFTLLWHEFRAKPYMERGDLEQVVLRCAHCKEEHVFCQKYDPSATRCASSQQFQKLLTKVPLCSMSWYVGVLEHATVPLAC